VCRPRRLREESKSAQVEHAQTSLSTYKQHAARYMLQESPQSDMKGRATSIELRNGIRRLPGLPAKNAIGHASQTAEDVAPAVAKGPGHHFFQHAYL
jgi:hypothetical protein